MVAQHNVVRPHAALCVLMQGKLIEYHLCSMQCFNRLVCNWCSCYIATMPLDNDGPLPLVQIKYELLPIVLIVIKICQEWL